MFIMSTKIQKLEQIKWKLIYYEILKNKSIALKRENEIKKNQKLRKTIKLKNNKEILL